MTKYGVFMLNNVLIRPSYAAWFVPIYHELCSSSRNVLQDVILRARRGLDTIWPGIGSNDALEYPFRCLIRRSNPPPSITNLGQFRCQPPPHYLHDAFGH